MDQVTALERFLREYARPELAELYHGGMEVQVTVAQDGGTRVEGDYRGARWHGWTDGKVIWKPFRIPWGSWSEPHYELQEQTWSLIDHAEGVGLSGWDWRAKLSRWVGFDFDSLVSHQQGLSDVELEQLLREVEQVPWVTTRRSTSGRGVHLYVFLSPPLEVINHHEHAALARALLALLETRCSYPLRAKVDSLGRILWIWHRGATTGGYELLQRGEPLDSRQVPGNWREHVEVVTRRLRRLPSSASQVDVDALEELAAGTRQIALDPEHRRLLEWLSVHVGGQGLRTWWWDGDRHLLVAHTLSLREAHRSLRLRGFFETTSSGSTAQNCFAFPLADGGWVVRRHGRGVQESPLWSRDASGWTRCTLNLQVTLEEAMAAAGAVETARGGWCFEQLAELLRALKPLQLDVRAPTALRERRSVLEPTRPKKRDRYVIRAVASAGDKVRDATWLNGGRHWERVVVIPETGRSVVAASDPELIRHVTSNQGDAGWYLQSRGRWVQEPKDNLRSALISLGYSRAHVEELLGRAVLRHWRLVAHPFESEYPGNRQWNLKAARLAVQPRPGDHQTWDLLFDHLGQGLTEAVQRDLWAQEHKLIKGGDYLRCWFASLFQEPREPLPYLAFYGPELSGKSSLHEAIGTFLLHEGQGYVKADTALTSSGNFNAELQGAVLCVVEEINLRRAKAAYEKLKDWVTTPVLSIHVKGRTPFQLANTTHWIQTMNDPSHVPVLPGDTRVVLIHVELPKDPLPKRLLFERLKHEAPAFLNSLLQLELPPTNERLRIPALVTVDKIDQATANATRLQQFLAEECHYVTGEATSVQAFLERFQRFLDADERPYWTRARVLRELPAHFPRGRWDSGGGSSFHVGNLLFEEREATQARLVRVPDSDQLRRVTEFEVT